MKKRFDYTTRRFGCKGTTRIQPAGAVGQADFFSGEGKKRGFLQDGHFPAPGRIFSFGDAMKRTLALGCALLFAALLLLRPQEAAAAVGDALRLCAGTVIPSLFPFFVAVRLLTSLGLGDYFAWLFSPLMRPLFHVNGQGAAALLLGLLGGYPTGAASVAELYRQGDLSREEASVLLGFCNNCGPAFLLQYIGAGIFHSPRAGAALLAVHIASALVTGIAVTRLAHVRPREGGRGLDAPKERLSAAFTGSVTGSVGSVLSICGYVIVFRVAAGLFPGAVPPELLGVFELVSGTAGLRPGQWGFAAAAALTAWGGFSVHAQTFSVAGDVPMGWYFRGKLIQTAAAGVIGALAGGLIF